MYLAGCFSLNTWSAFLWLFIYPYTYINILFIYYCCFDQYCFLFSCIYSIMTYLLTGNLVQLSFICAKTIATATVFSFISSIEPFYFIEKMLKLYTVEEHNRTNLKVQGPSLSLAYFCTYFFLFDFVLTMTLW